MAMKTVLRLAIDLVDLILSRLVNASLSRISIVMSKIDIMHEKWMAAK